jgi:hypothetical protein
MLRPVKVELEDDTVRALEVLATPTREQRAQRSAIGPVTHPNGMPETIEQIAIEGATSG